MILCKEDLLQRYRERSERLSQQDRVIKFCIDAGFLTTVEVGQYFMTKTLKDSHNLQNQWLVVSTFFPRDEKSTDPKRWIRGNTKIGLVLEVTICCFSRYI